MDTSANKELVCMLLQGIASKLPEEHQSLVATAETAIRGKEAPVDEIVEEICSDDEVAIKDGFATFCEFVGISEEDISLDEITAAFQGEMLGWCLNVLIKILRLRKTKFWKFTSKMLI